MATPPTPALTELLAHTRWIEDLARSLVRDPNAAADLAQSTILTALEGRRPPRRNLRAWLATVLRNKARERDRRESSRAIVERQGARHEALPSAEEIVERAECERRVVAAVLALEEPHRSTLLLRYFEGLSPEEIARRSNAPLSTISSRINRAHARLREKLSSEGSRIEWTAAIAPILLRKDSAAALSAPFVTGVFVMSTAVKIVVAASIVALVAWLAWPDAKPDDETARAAPIPPAEASTGASAEKSGLDASSNDKLSRAEAAAPAKPAVETPAPAPVAKPPAVPAAAGGRIFGRVFRPDDEPAPNRKIRMVLMGKGAKEKYASTDATGSFDERELEPGSWSLATWPDEAEVTAIGKTFSETVQGMAYLTQATVDLERGEEVELELGKKPKTAVRLHGRLLWHGKAVDGFTQWLPDGRDSMDRQRIAQTGANKTYEVVLDAPGRHLVVVGQSNSRTEHVVDVPDVRELEHDIVLPELEISGRVVTQDGVPVKDARVDLVPRAAHNPRNPAATGEFNKRTDEAGKFTFQQVPRARFALSAHGGTLGKESTVFPAAVAADDVDLVANDKPAEIVIVVPAGTRAKGVVRDVESNVWKAGVFVFASNGEPVNPLDPVPVEKDGRFELFALAPGRWFVVAARGMRWSDVERFEVPAEGAIADLELDLVPAAKLTVDIQGLEPAWIDVRDANRCSLSSLTDRNVFDRNVNRDWSSTSFVFRLPSGNYDIAVIGTGKERTDRSSLIQGQEATVRIGAK